MINKNARYVGQIPIYEHFQKRSRITGANAPTQNPISNVWDIPENNGDGAGAKGIKQHCNLNPNKCKKEKKKMKRAGREHRERRLTSTMK